MLFTQRMTRKYLSFGALLFSDTIALILSFYAAFILRAKILAWIAPEFFAGRMPVNFSMFLDRWYIVFVTIIVFAVEGLYTKRHAFWEETRLLLKSSTMSFGLIMTAIFITKEYFPFSRLIVAMAWLLSFILLPAFRRLVKKGFLRLGIWSKRVLIIGSTEETAKVIESIKANGTMGYEIVGCLTDDRNRIGETLSGVPILGHYDDIEAWKAKTSFEDIIVTFPNIPRNRLIFLLKTWEGISETIRYIPQTGDLITTGIEIENIGKILSLVVRKNLHKPWNIILKSVFEYVLAFVFLVLIFPVLLAVAVAVKLDSPGPVFFLQSRLGRKGKVITIVKFRTMYTDEKQRLAAFLRSHPQAREEWETFNKLKDKDPRVTRVGRFLRRHSLDELPQLLNVLGGTMSLVGPRPYLPGEIDGLRPFPTLLFEVKPGITGMWQISGRSDVPFQERLRIDEHYIRNWSLWMDIMILLKTFGATISGRGAF
jgi:Undecaprenyl-phosphate galactose phosphotransferase WbaP